MHKSTSDKVSFQVTPEDAVISVYDKDGERLTPSADSLMVYENILQGEAYTWNISKYGYISRQGSFTGGEVSDITAELVKQDATQPEITDNDWINFRNSETNNGITGSSTPTSADSTLLKWTTRIGVGWEAAITPPLILGGAVYVASGQFIYKLDKNTGEILQTSEQLSGNMQYAMIPLTYAEGMLFAQIGGGQIQAVSATSLKSLWISESLGGQTLSPITYKDGYIYTREPGTPRLQQALISVCLLQTRIHPQERRLNTAPGNTTIRAAFTGLVPMPHPITWYLVPTTVLQKEQIPTPPSCIP